MGDLTDPDPDEFITPPSSPRRNELRFSADSQIAACRRCPSSVGGGPADPSRERLSIHRHDRPVDERGNTAHRRDRAAAERDSAAEERDRATEARDRATEERDRAAAEHQIGEHEQAARDRGENSRDRERSAEDRKHAEERDSAAAERDAAAEERASAAAQRTTSHDSLAVLARDAAARDREESARDRAQAGIDGLTGALRRGRGLVDLQREIDRTRRSDAPLVLAFLDVDGLKAINDADGHAAGDQLLRDVALAVTARLRSYDLLVRYGGDEFLCTLSGGDIKSGRRRFAEVARDLKQRIPAASFSSGLAVLTDADTLDELIARADAALYTGRRDSRAQAGS
jgi:diguanylate cyclase (GGDEF)-like protein